MKSFWPDLVKYFQNYIFVFSIFSHYQLLSAIFGLVGSTNSDYKFLKKQTLTQPYSTNIQGICF